MQHSKGGPRAQLLDPEEMEMYRPRLFKRRAQNTLNVGRIIIIGMLIVTAVLLALDHSGVMNTWLGI